MLYRYIWALVMQSTGTWHNLNSSGGNGHGELRPIVGTSFTVLSSIEVFNHWL